MRKLNIEKAILEANFGRGFNELIVRREKYPMILKASTNVKLADDIAAGQLVCSTPDIYDDWELFDK